MKKTAEIHRLLNEMMNRYGLLTPATVKAVNEELFTCTVENDGIEFYNVRLNATGDGKKGILPIPKVGSTVIVAAIGSETDLAIVSFSELNKLYLNADEIVFNYDKPDDEKESFIVTSELITQLNRLSKRVDDIMTAITSAEYLAYDGGKTLQSNIGLAFEKITSKEDFSTENFINPKITH